MHRLLFTLGLILLAAPAAAQPEMVFPYSGVLDLDGAPFTGTVQMRFRLYSGDVAPPVEGEDPPAIRACADAPSCLWQGTHAAVPVFQGRFTVRLGAVTDDPARPLGGVLRGGPQLHLELAVRPSPDDDWTHLAGRQQIAPVPQALWSADQANLALDTLDVAGATTTDSLAVAGASSADTLVVSGAATVGSLRAGELRIGADGVISDAIGAVTVDDALVVRSGLISDGATTMRGTATIEGDTFIGDLRVTAESGLITDSDGPVTIGDSLVVGGQAEFRSDAGATFAGDVVAPYFDGRPRIVHHTGLPDAVSRRQAVVDANLVRSPVDRSACFLTYTSIAGLDNDAADWGYCHVLHLGPGANNQWIVRAYASPDTDSVSCQATCLTW